MHKEHKGCGLGMHVTTWNRASCCCSQLGLFCKASGQSVLVCYSRHAVLKQQHSTWFMYGCVMKAAASPSQAKRYAEDDGLQGCDNGSMPQPSTTISHAHAAAQQPLAIQHHAQQAQAIPKPGTAGASTWVRVAAANRTAAGVGVGVGEENLPPAGVEPSAQPACKAPKHSHVDTPHCAEQRPQQPAALQVSNEILTHREGHLASATASGDESSSCCDSSAPQATCKRGAAA